MGLAYVSSGHPADRRPGPAGIPSDANFPYVSGGSGDCEASSGNFCVRVESPGVVPLYSMRAAFGYYVIPRLAFAAFARYQFDAGNQKGYFTPRLLLGLRAQVVLTKPKATGWRVEALAGGSVGEIQAKPDQRGAAEEPYIYSGLTGAQVGFIVGYRPWRNFGFFVQPEAMFQFPAFLFNMDFAAGIDVAF